MALNSAAMSHIKPYKVYLLNQHRDKGKACTNGIVAKPTDIPFVSGVKENRGTFLPPGIIDQVTVVKHLIVLEVEMVHLA